jgi:N6-L-threonylcarbamoyladenine synthase
VVSLNDRHGKTRSNDTSSGNVKSRFHLPFHRSLPIMPARKPSPLKTPKKPLLCLGIEGSANKLGCGVISHTPSSPGSSRATTVTVLSNVRHTYITPPGEGFLPSDTARHHREWVVRVVEEAVKKAGIWIGDLDCIAFTKGGSQCCLGGLVPALSCLLI